MSPEAQSRAQHVIRPIVESEWPVFMDLLDLSFHENPSKEERALWISLTDVEQTISVWDDAELIGTAGAYNFHLTVPGGAAVPAAGVTLVSVNPTHRRRGVLTSMMRHQLDGIHEEGHEPVAVLTASEPAIYGRFGYGLGTLATKWSVPRGAHVLAAVPGSEKFRIRLVKARDVYEQCKPIYDQHVAARPGMLARDDRWREQALFDHESTRGGAGPMRCVVAEDAEGNVAAYARYRVKESWDTPGRPTCKVLVLEIMGRDAASYSVVWRFLLNLDLTDEVIARSIPADDPIGFLLNDTRAAQPLIRDSLYTRLVDVDRALAARRYAAPVDVVFEVADTFCPWNAGRWRLTGDQNGAACERTTDPADVLLGIRELGSAYLGGFTLAAMARASRVEELRPGALAAASLAFTSDRAPWLPFGF